MTNRYLTSLTRFACTMLAGGIMLRLLVRIFPTDSISVVGSHYQDSLGALAYDALLSSVAITGRGLAIALPLAVLFGLMAGLKPGSKRDRILTAPAALLAGAPALPAALAIVCALTIDLDWLGMNGSVHLALGVAMWPWITLAVRESIAAVVAEGQGLHPGRALTAIIGAILSQSGNIALGGLAIGVYLVPDDGLLRLLELSSRLEDPVLLYVLLAPTVPVIALLHLAGDTLTAYAGGPGRPGGRLSRTWAGLGALLLATGLYALVPHTIASLNTWLIALGATVVAAFLGICMSLLGPLVHRQGLPSLLAPVMTGLLFPVLFTATPGMQIAAIGAGCALTLAAPLRRLLNAPGAARRTAAVAAAGAGLLALGQALAAELTLGIMNVGLRGDLPTLGHLIRTSLLSDPTAQNYGPVLLALATTAGLFLLGLALKEKAGDEIVAGQLSAPEEQVGVEPDQHQEPTEQSAGDD